MHLSLKRWVVVFYGLMVGLGIFFFLRYRAKPTVYGRYFRQKVVDGKLTNACKGCLITLMPAYRYKESPTQEGYITIQDTPNMFYTGKFTQLELNKKISFKQVNGNITFLNINTNGDWTLALDSAAIYKREE